MFGFSKRKKAPPCPAPPGAGASMGMRPPPGPPPGPGVGMRPPPGPGAGAGAGAHCFGVKTRIAKSVGKDDKYRCGSVRALPSINRDEVVLQATDGHQATCLLTNGQMSTSRLVPVSVLPTRQLQRPVGVRLVNGRWESMDGKIAVDDNGGDQGSFPKLGEVLPAVGKIPFYETAVQAERRRSTDPTPSMHVAVGIDLELLRKAAEALGTTQLTLFVPVPVKDANKRPSETFVDKPVAVCPANRDADGQGVAVIMPLTPENGTAYYAKVREVVVASEQRAINQAQPHTRRAG